MRLEVADERARATYAEAENPEADLDWSGLAGWRWAIGHTGPGTATETVRRH